MDDPNELFQGQDSGGQTSRDQDRRAPGQDGREDGNRLLNLRKEPVPAGQLGSREGKGGDQSGPAYLYRFPMLTRGRSKLKAERSGLDGVVADVVWGGRKKRKAELIEKDLNKMKEQLESMPK